MTTRQARYWIATLKYLNNDNHPQLHDGIVYTKGQLEQGTDGYLHWQFIIYCDRKRTLRWVKNHYRNDIHIEPSRSNAVEEYVFKQDSAVPGTQFELGEKPFRRNNHSDWELVWSNAQIGNLEQIPADIRVRCYSTLKRIEKDYLVPSRQEREVIVYWGGTGLGKSRRAWYEAGWDAYPKDPRTKFWDGYQGQEHVVIDEFRGGVDIGHILRWFDRYPVIVECKYGAISFKAKKIWITSNLSPDQWYLDLDTATLGALRRRIKVTRFFTEWKPEDEENEFRFIEEYLNLTE